MTEGEYAGLLAVLQYFVPLQEGNSESSSLELMLLCAFSLCPGLSLLRGSLSI